jgi:predicted GIY-YIG superfamily endonuclease
MSQWSEFDPCSNELPDVPACYVLTVDGKYLYVGSTNHLYRRFLVHDIQLAWGAGYLTPWGQCSSIRARYRVTNEYRDLESRLIRKLQPSLNCVGSVRARSRMPRMGGVPCIPVIVRGFPEMGFATVTEFVNNAPYREVSCLTA